MKLLVWVLLGVLVYLAVRKNMKASDSKKPGANWADDGQNVRGSVATKPSEAMLSCAQCQVFIPASEAIHRGSHAFCCDEHAQQYTSQ